MLQGATRLRCGTWQHDHASPIEDGFRPAADAVAACASSLALSMCTACAKRGEQSMGRLCTVGWLRDASAHASRHIALQIGAPSARPHLQHRQHCLSLPCILVSDGRSLCRYRTLLTCWQNSTSDEAVPGTVSCQHWDSMSTSSTSCWRLRLEAPLTQWGRCSTAR
jgi:hypothetical protein